MSSNVKTSTEMTLKQKTVSFLALFTSTGTLLCCALPAALAALAGGAAISAYLSTFPWVIPLAQYKGWIFLVAGVLIGLNGILTFRPQGKLACAITGGQGCEIAGKFSKVMFWIAVSIYGIGVFMTYGIVPLLRLLDK